MMNSNTLIALQITVIGMGLVFAAIFLLWGIMRLLVRVTEDEGKKPIDDEESQRIRLAAASAVAIALIQESIDTELHEFPLPPTAQVSPWQAVMRSRALNKRGPIR